MLDVVNSGFIWFGGLFILLSCFRLWKTHGFYGVSLWHSGFMVLWSFWNLWFFAGIHAWWSFAGATGIAVSNTLWFVLLKYYKKVHE
jgi:hypothetical protein